MNSKYKKTFSLILGLFITALAFNIFLLPNDLVAYGVNGIAIIASESINIPSWLFILMFNLFLLIIGLLCLDYDIILKTYGPSLLFPLFVLLTSFIAPFINLENADTIIIVFFAGLLVGYGNGLMYRYDYSYGGIEIISKIVSNTFKIENHRSTIIIQLFIILLGGIVFGAIEMVYALILYYISYYVMKKIYLNIDTKKTFIVVTNKSTRIKKYIKNSLNCDVTIMDLDNKSFFNNKKMIVCIIDNNGYYKLKEGIQIIDTNAFCTIIKSHEVFNSNKKLIASKS